MVPIVSLVLWLTVSPAAGAVTHSIGFSSAVLFTSYDSTPYAQPASVSLAYDIRLDLPLFSGIARPAGGAAIEIAAFPRRDERYGSSTMLLPRAELGLLWPLPLWSGRLSLASMVGGGIYRRRVSRGDDIEVGRRPVGTARLEAAVQAGGRWRFAADPGVYVFFDDEPVLAFRFGVSAGIRLGGDR
jgi:hypothetical protein